MRKKNWLIGAAALAAVVTFGAFGVHSVKATETDSKSAKESIVFEQVGDRTYSGISTSSNGILLESKDHKYYARIDRDGTLTELDNTDNKYKTIGITSSSQYDNSILSINDGKLAVLNYDGSYAYGTDKYYNEIFGLRVKGESLCAYVDDGVIYVNDISGKQLFKANVEDGYKKINNVSGYNKYVVISYLTSEGHKVSYYDLEGNVVSGDKVYDSVNYDSVNYENKNSKLVFNEYIKLDFENGYHANSVGVLKGQKVYYATKSGAPKAILDEEGNVLIENINNSYSAFGDMVVTRKNMETANKKEYEYTINKATLVTEINKDDKNNSVADITAENPTDNVSYDDLDTDAQEVYNQKFNFSAKAADGVIADGASLSVEKVLAGKDYEAAKNVTKDVANHIAVFNINLFKEGAKIQPNGKIEFTVDVPKNFNSDLVAVYRLSEDGNSYTKLESTVKDGKVTFLTDHFSTYMIVEEKQEVVEPSKPATDNNEVADTTPGTGDVANYAIYAAAMLCAAGMLVIASKKRAK